MESKDLIILVAVFAAVGFSLYRKYMKKNQDKTGGANKSQVDSQFHVAAKDDDYEPYSGK